MQKATLKKEAQRATQITKKMTMRKKLKERKVKTNKRAIIKKEVKS